MVDETTLVRQQAKFALKVGIAYFYQLATMCALAAILAKLKQTYQQTEIILTLKTKMANKTSQHILGTSANLLGFCLFVITSLHLAIKTENTLIDEFTCIVALLLTVSSVFPSYQLEQKIKIENINLNKLQIIYSSFHSLEFLELSHL